MLLARRFIDEFATQLRRGPVTLSPAAEETLLRYAWPGNVRELRNVLERAVLLSDSPVLGVEDLRFNDALVQTEDSASTRFTLEEMEVRYLQRILDEEGWRVTEAAARLDVPRSSLYQKIKKYGLSRPDLP